MNKKLNIFLKLMFSLSVVSLVWNIPLSSYSLTPGNHIHFISNSYYSNIQDNDYISIIESIEDKVFGYRYINDSFDNRLSRLEQELLGTTSNSDSTQIRLDRLKSSIGISSKQELQIAKEMTQNLKEDANISYPIVDKMEQEIFRTLYSKDDIYNRLDRLEAKVFNKTVPDSSLNERIEALKASVLKYQDNSYANSYNVQNPILSDNNTSNDFITDDNKIPSYYGKSNSLEDVEIKNKLSLLEQNILKRNYGQEANDIRLSRLESKVFERNFINDDDITRIERLSAVSTAKQSAPIDNNKLMRGLSTGIQIGGILLMILAMIL